MRFLSRDAIPVFLRSPGFEQRPSPPIRGFDVFYTDPLIVGLHAVASPPADSPVVGLHAVTGHCQGEDE